MRKQFVVYFIQLDNRTQYMHNSYCWVTLPTHFGGWNYGLSVVLMWYLLMSPESASATLIILFLGFRNPLASQRQKSSSTAITFVEVLPGLIGKYQYQVSSERPQFWNLIHPLPHSSTFCRSYSKFPLLSYESGCTHKLWCRKCATWF